MKIVLDKLIDKDIILNNPFYGKTHSEKTKRKMVDKKKKKEIIGTNLETGKEIYFKSVREARRNGYEHAGDVARGKHKSCEGYIFKFI